MANTASIADVLHVHIIQHEHHETPGHIEDWLSERGCEHTIIKARNGFADVKLEDIQYLFEQRRGCVSCSTYRCASEQRRNFSG